MYQSKCYFFQDSQIQEGVVLKALNNQNKFLVLSSFQEVLVHQKNMVLIEDYPSNDFWNKQDNPRPRYTYSKEEFIVLWNYSRSNVDNLVDIFRYYQQQSKGFHPLYWQFMLSDLSIELQGHELDIAWNKAIEINLKKYAQLNDLSVFQEGETVAFHVFNQTIIFTHHAVERTFERLNIQKQNFRSLVYTMLQEAVPLKTKKKTANSDTFLYNDMFNWTFVLQKGNFKNTYYVMTCYEPSINWRKFEVIEDSPFFQDEIEEAS